MKPSHNFESSCTSFMLAPNSNFSCFCLPESFQEISKKVLAHTEIPCHTLFSLNNMLKCQLNSLSCAANQCLQGLQLYIQVSMTRKKNISKTWKANGSQNTPVSRQPTVDDMDSKFKSNFDFKDLKVVLWMHTRRASMVLKWSGSIESTMAIKCYQTTSWKH